VLGRVQLSKRPASLLVEQPIDLVPAIPQLSRIAAHGYLRYEAHGGFLCREV
jgi:hypothetical protein